MNPNRDHQGAGCCRPTCPPLEPIVLPCRVCTIHRCFPVEQPVIVPTHTRIINRGVPVNRFYPSFTQSEETICPGQAGQTPLAE
ncbi:TPA: hypothetical protein GXZ34_00090 [bacterium]|nr:hypothetical protein [bacterium]